MMADKPILFSGPMVRALLAGTKTQTRRIAKIKSIMGDMVPVTSPDESLIELEPGEFRQGRMHYASTGALSGPYSLKFAVGDRLYVREHWRTFVSLDKIAPRHLWWPESGKGAGVLYIADNSGMSLTTKGERFYGDREGDAEAFGKHRQAMHMPRWASRLTLTVTDVRVERLQDISEEDATAEGVKPWPLGDWFDAGFGLVEANRVFSKALYCGLWDHINGKGAWASNPWVAAYSFTVERGNIDKLASAA